MSIGVWQVILILLIVLIIFGAGKLPKVMGDVAKGVKNFKKGMREDEDEQPVQQIDADSTAPMSTNASANASTNASTTSSTPSSTTPGDDERART